MLRRLSFILAYLSLGLVILITTLLSVDRQQLKSQNTFRELSTQTQMPQRSAIRRFALSLNNSEASEDLTREDLLAAASKWDAARSVLDSFWRQSFAQRGIPYSTPRVLYMTSEVVNTGCGRVERNGPFYCPNDHTIYCDPFFVAKEMKTVGTRLGTDGDMAAVMIESHEWGHAVQRLLGVRNSGNKFNELQADCLAGGFARYSQVLGLMEKGDLEEAQMAIADGGDASNDHGTPQERMESFMFGYQRGGGACWGN